MNELEKARAVLDAAEQRGRELSAERAALQRKRELLNQRIAAASAGTDPAELAAMLGEREALQMLLDNMGRAVPTVEHERQQAHIEVGKLYTRAAGLQLSIEDGEAAIVHCRREVSDAEGKLVQAKRQLAASEERLAALRERQAALTGELALA